MTTSELKASISTLTEYQTKQIAARVQEYLHLNDELQDTTPQMCPRCNQHGPFIKKGFSGRKQRYQCKCCGRKFPYDALQLMYWSHQTPDKWSALIEDTISIKSLKKVEEDLGVSHPTAHHMRHKFLAFLSENMKNMPALDRIIEADETFVLESRKGTRVLDREPRKHGEAKKYHGYPYVWGGSSSTSFDGSGFVCWVLNQSSAMSTEHTTATGIYNSCTVIPKSDAKPGDLIFFIGTYNSLDPISHIGIYVGDGMMAHCEDLIQFASIKSSYWRQYFYALTRIP